jgi:hypothetical protein
MLKALNSFISDIFVCLTPEMALAGGIPMPAPIEDKPSITLNKGATAFNPFNIWGGFKGATASPFKFAGGKGPAPTPIVPKPPENTLLATPPTAPVPPAPPTSSDTVNAAQEGYANGMKGFGYKASLLRNGSKDPATNTATGTGSLLGS